MDLVGCGRGRPTIGGLAGTVDVNTIDLDTRAYIDGGVVVNGDNSGAGDKQDVYVVATNDLTFFAIEGGLGIGIGGIAGAVDVDMVHNDTTAYIAGTVNARRDVHVSALANWELETVIVSVGAGGAGIAGSVGVYTLGGTLIPATHPREYSNTLNDADGNSTDSYTDDQVSSTKNATMLDAFSDPNNDFDTYNTSSIKDATSSVNMKVNASVPDTMASSTLAVDVVGSQSFLPRGTSAFIAEHSVVTAGRDVDVDARQRIDIKTKVGGIGVGGVGVGAGVAIVNVDNPVTSYIGEAQ